MVVGMQDNEYTDAQVGDAGGLFKSLDPAPCGAVPAYLIQCSSSSLPDPVLRFQSTSSSASDPVYLIQCSMQSGSSSAPVPCSLAHPVLRFHAVWLIQCSSSSLPHPVQSTSSSTPVQKTLISCSFVHFFSFKFHFF